MFKRRRIRVKDPLLLQAGLTMGYYLKQEGYNFLLLEAGTELGIHGEIDMILLQPFTPREYSRFTRYGSKRRRK